MEKHSKTFCPLPFMALDIVDGAYSPCCLQDRDTFREYKTIKEYLNSEKLKTLKHNLANGIQDALCSKCWQLENNGLKSMRQSVLRDRADVDTLSISQVKLHTGRMCNLACMMCFPSLSSTWSSLWKDENYAEPFYKKQGHEKYDEQAEQYIFDNLDNIKFIETLGGEPLFNKRFHAFLDRIIDMQKSKNITLYIITNGTLLKDELIGKFERFKKVVLSVSIDGIGSVNDYIRWGSSFETIDSNLLRNKKYVDIAVLPTVMSLNLHRLNEIEEYCEKNNFHMMQPALVQGWASLNPINQPKYLYDLTDDKNKSYIQSDQNTGNLREFIRKWDIQRKCNILNYMPEFEEFMNNG